MPDDETMRRAAIALSALIDRAKLIGLVIDIDWDIPTLLAAVERAERDHARRVN